MLDGRSEWLEADGLGGFASGTAGGIRTRRYHALLLAAATPPTGRFVLVNGFDAWVETPGRRFDLTSQAYAPDTLHPDGAHRIASFASEPWPTWILRCEDGTEILQEIVVPEGSAIATVRWRLMARSTDETSIAISNAAGDRQGGVKLCVRLFLSGRDYHSLHHENSAFRFDPRHRGEQILFRPYDGVPAVTLLTNGGYEHAPDWYRNFRYDEERARGLDFLEDLAAPGILSWNLDGGDAALILAADGLDRNGFLESGDATEVLARIHESESCRRKVFSSRLEKSADAYIVSRGPGKTIVAGYPWFTDWGRDTFIALRGLCLATGRLDDARDILIQWAGAVSQGMLPNLFPDAGATPEYNSVDASLWYVVAVHEFLEAVKAARKEFSVNDHRPPGETAHLNESATPQRRGIEPKREEVVLRRSELAKKDQGAGNPSALTREHESALRRAVLAIVEGYATGTRFGIRMDDDGLLAAGVPGVQLTWMDAKIGDWAVTPRIGKPVEVEALWLNALRIASAWEETWEKPFRLGWGSFLSRFWNEQRDCLFDVVDVDHVHGTEEATLRPNQIFAVGGLPYALLDGDRARRIVETVEARLFTPSGLRSLAPGGPGYAPRYQGGAHERDAAYHQGTVWPWLLGPFVEAWVRVRGGGDAVKSEARARFLTPLLAHLDDAGIGHLFEIADAEPPHTPRGCPFQAWSVGEAIRLDRKVLAIETPRSRTRTSLPV